MRPLPDATTVGSATAAALYRRRPGPLKPLDDIAGRRLRIRQETLTLLHDLLVHAYEESYGAEISARTCLPQGTVSDQLRRLRDAGWLTCPPRRRHLLAQARSSRGEAPTVDAPTTPSREGRRAAQHEIQTRSFPTPRTPTDQWDKTTDRTSSPDDAACRTHEPDKSGWDLRLFVGSEKRRRAAEHN